MDAVLVIAVPALASATILTCLLGPIIGYLLGFASGVKFNKKLNNTTSNAPSETETDHSMVTSVYEDINLEKKWTLLNCFPTFICTSSILIAVMSLQ